MIENSKNYHAPMHTAEHILNQTMVRFFGTSRSFSNHIERKKSKCDYHFTRPLTEDEIKKINQQVNDVISQNLPVNEHFIKKSEAIADYDLSKLPEDSGETLRIIKVGNYDSCFCSGEHVKNTSEIGKFAISTVSYEDGVLRIRYKLG